MLLMKEGLLKGRILSGLEFKGHARITSMGVCEILCSENELMNQCIMLEIRAED